LNWRLHEALQPKRATTPSREQTRLDGRGHRSHLQGLKTLFIKTLFIKTLFIVDSLRGMGGPALYQMVSAAAR
jgi:hypothetical protein